MIKLSASALNPQNIFKNGPIVFYSVLKIFKILSPLPVPYHATIVYEYKM
jgi:hypothetical protein